MSWRLEDNLHFPSTVEKARAEKAAAVKMERETGSIVKFGPDSENGRPFATWVPRV